MRFGAWRGTEWHDGESPGIVAPASRVTRDRGSDRGMGRGRAVSWEVQETFGMGG